MSHQSEFITKRVSLLIFAVLLFATTEAYAVCTTNVSGTITGATWTLSGSPYCVEGNIIVNSLTIEPSVRVEFLDDYRFDVLGTLTAVGSESGPILFRKEENNATGWQGIFFDNSPDGSELKHCRIEDSINSGIRISNSIPVIEDCAMSNNSAINGGGLNIDLSTTTDELVLKNCLVSSNTSSSHGGGMYANIATGTLRLEGCTFSNNQTNPDSRSVRADGGGIYFESAAGGVVFTKSDNQSCNINGNQALSICRSFGCSISSAGGGILVRNGELTLEACNIGTNSSIADEQESSGRGRATSFGGGIHVSSGTVTLINSIVSANSTKPDGNIENHRGGGIYISSGALFLVNSNIVNNSEEGIRNNSGVVTTTNSIIFFNEGSQFVGNAAINFCNVEGGSRGTGNISLDPNFINPPTDYRLMASSPCINAGDNSAPGLPDTDFDGNPRIMKRIVDIGAFESEFDSERPFFADDFESGDQS